jgi:hypothetical protein
MRIRINWRITALTIAGATLAIFIAANAHLVYVALESQPDCIPHQKASGSDFQAARSAC